MRPRHYFALAAIVIAAHFLKGCAPVVAEASPPGRLVESGVASFYWQPQGLACERGRFDPGAMTAAHKRLPCGTRVRVVSRSTGKAVDVRINDRGPYVRGRVIDLSRRAAADLGMVGKGLDTVDIHRLD